ncbi:serine protease [Elusimicrobiota bacterium]
MFRLSRGPGYHAYRRGHCISQGNSCKSTKFVFGFAVNNEGEYPETVPADNVYGCREVRARYFDYYGADFAFVQLDREVSGRIPLKLNTAEAISKDAALVVAGYPDGLPVKIAGNAKVLDPMLKRDYFVANLDVFIGTSGGPVVNANTLLVEGILVRANKPHYVWEGNCYASNVRSDKGVTARNNEIMAADSTKAELLALFMDRVLDTSLPALSNYEVNRIVQRRGNPRAISPRSTFQIQPSR